MDSIGSFVAAFSRRPDLFEERSESFSGDEEPEEKE
jgi:hypothetical protein